MVDISLIRQLGKQAALAHSHSRNIRMNSPEGREDAARHLNEATGNAQNPYRFGRTEHQWPTTSTTTPTK